jgi:ATP-dependent Lhr-like helicase
MDVENASKVLHWIQTGEVAVKVFGPTEVPSPFAHHVVVRGYSDIVLMEDRKKMLIELHRRVLEELQRRRKEIRETYLPKEAYAEGP